MSGHIKQLRLYNFKRFQTLDLNLSPDLNVLIGDNESGKSTVLQAIDLAISGSRSKVESYGIDHLMNRTAIEQFDSIPNKSIQDLPSIRVEVFLSEQYNLDTNGKCYLNANSACDGLVLLCEPDQQYHQDILNIISDPNCKNIPYELYSISCFTFSGKTFNSYTKPYRDILIDGSTVNAEMAMKQYVKDIYCANVDTRKRSINQSKYREMKMRYETTVLSHDCQDTDYKFTLKNSIKNNLESDITISENNIEIDNQGRGKQCFVKTKLAISNARGIETLLLEEPENHLSHTSMQQLISLVKEATGCQLFVSTHSNMICSGLNLQKALIFSPHANSVVSLRDVQDDTSKFFQKAPDNNLLQFILSQRVILVEGNAEYILMDGLYEKEQGFSSYHNNIHIISVGGLKFLRYLEIAKQLNIKVAVITDNDGNYEKNINEKYIDYQNEPHIKIFSDSNESNTTFEICVYNDNKELCDKLFQSSQGNRVIQKYMLSNKAECAFTILNNGLENFVTPSYIKNAIKWISEN